MRMHHTGRIGVAHAEQFAFGVNTAFSLNSAAGVGWESEAHPDICNQPARSAAIQGSEVRYQVSKPMGVDT
jgi:hypothetical protein